MTAISAGTREMDWLTSSTILRSLHDFGDRTAWEEFTSRFRSPIVGFAREMGLSPADAEDAAQESFLAFATAYRNGNYDPAKGRLSHWLFGIAARQIRNTRRRISEREARLADRVDTTSFWADLPDPEASEDSWDREWSEAVLQHCLDRVRREVEFTTYRAFEIVIFENRAPSDAARELGLSDNAVYIAKHRLLTRIRELRAEFEITA